MNIACQCTLQFAALGREEVSKLRLFALELQREATQLAEETITVFVGVTDGGMDPTRPADDPSLMGAERLFVDIAFEWCVKDFVHAMVTAHLGDRFESDVPAAPQTASVTSPSEEKVHG